MMFTTEKILHQRTVFITGASRGIGRAIALRFAQAGANVVITGKTTEPHPTLTGTIHSVADEVLALGANSLALQLDVRDEAAIAKAVRRAAEHFGGIDILINNASAIQLLDTQSTTAKRFDLMMDVNARATYLCSQACVPILKQSFNPHILNLSPPLSMRSHWFKNHVAYTMAKYGMSMCTLGMSDEFSALGIAVNSLWPRTTIATAAIAVNFPPAIYAASRKPEIVAQAALQIVSRNSREATGNFYIDETVLKACGEIDFDQYAVNPGAPLWTDLFLDTESAVGADA
jgi:citronellol/citronellal dehydrogenase